MEAAYRNARRPRGGRAVRGSRKGGKVMGMTLEEYLRTPETVLPAELAYGVLRVADAPLTHHQRAVAYFFRALDAHVLERRMGEVWFAPVDVILDAARALVVQPDLLFVSHARSGIVQERIYGAPDMVLEILSPMPRIGRIEERIGWFARYGVRECWLYRPFDRRLVILSLAEGRVAERRLVRPEDRIVSTVLPAFDRTVGDIVGG